MDSDYERILAAVRTTIAASKQQMPLSYAAGGPPDVYLPGGEHLVRPVLDSTGELFRPLRIHRTVGKRRTHCPDALQAYGPVGNYPRCEVCAHAAQHDDWRLRVEELTLLFGHLYTTQQPSPFWKPGQTYVIAMKTPLVTTMLGRLDTWLETQPEAMEAMFTPHGTGPALRLSVTQRPRWSLTLALTAATYPPIALGDWHRPLTDCWIGSEFDLSEYHAVLAALTSSA